MVNLLLISLNLCNNNRTGQCSNKVMVFEN
jgi:hypothetical protein